MPEELGLSQIGQISVHVNDMERAVAFYRDVLGMTFLFPAGHMSFFACGSVRLMLTTHLGAGEQTSIVYYKVDDLTSTVAALKERGAQVDGDPHCIAQMPNHDLWMAFLKDSESNTIGLMSEVHR